MKEKNTPKLWDGLWHPVSVEEDKYDIARLSNSIRWKRIEHQVIKRFGSFKNLKVIEIGGGSGANALMFSLRGSEVYVLDYSKNALKRCKLLFDRNKSKVSLIFGDALRLNKDLLNKFDISMSFGLVEHFTGDNRNKIIQSHFEVLKKGGMTIISVPNKWCFPYRLYKLTFESLGFWKFGEEHPYSRKEFRRRMRALGKKFIFIGDSFISSFGFINPIKLVRKSKKSKMQLSSTKRERGTILDNYFSYSLVLVAFN